MAETNGSSNLNTNNGNFICGVVEGKIINFLPKIYTPHLYNTFLNQTH